jgi:putative (di)nucleoside polyphosphate hydrolase
MSVLIENRDPSQYRPCAGIALFNRRGEVFIGERIDVPGAWQLPQGGIDDGEDFEAALFREMHEEIGTRNARIIRALPDWLYYDLPPFLRQRLNNKYLGQRQKWVALEFLGEDSEINLAAHHHPEFGNWKWVPLENLTGYAVPFKRDIYQVLVTSFADIAAQQK